MLSIYITEREGRMNSNQFYLTIPRISYFEKKYIQNQSQLDSEKGTRRKESKHLNIAKKHRIQNTEMRSINDNKNM